MMDYNEVSAQELIESFSTDYYEKKIEEIQKQIDNIKFGRPQYEGIYSSIQSQILYGEEAQKKIKQLEKNLKEKKRMLSELISLTNHLNSAIYKMEDLAQKDVLLDKLRNLLSISRFSYDEENKIYNEYEQMHTKLYRKSTKKIHTRDKISKDMYKLLKKNKNLRFGDGITIKGAFNESKYSMEHIFYSIFSELRRKYSSNLSSLGLDTKRISMVANEMQKEPTEQSLEWQGTIEFEKLNDIKGFIKKGYYAKSGYKDLRKLEEKYQEIIELSREIWYVEQLISIFKDSIIVDSELYKGLMELTREQSAKLREMINKTNKMYEKSGLQNKVDGKNSLSKLYQEMIELEQQIKHYEEIGDYNRVSALREQYYHIRYQMVKILKENPELNEQKFNIDIEKIIQKEKELLEPEIKKIIEEKQEHIEVEHKIDKQTTEEVPINQPRVEPKKEEVPVNEFKVEQKNEPKNIELDDNLQVHRTMHYQKYMFEKVKGSELGKIPFSEYLETVAPHLTELIAIEKDRERYANSIYREYIVYYGSLENKATAMNFYEYARRIYGIENIDVPVQKEEEYMGMTK